MELSLLEQKQLIEYVESLCAPVTPSSLTDHMVKFGNQWYKLYLREDAIWVIIPTSLEKPIKFVTPTQEDEECKNATNKQ